MRTFLKLFVTAVVLAGAFIAYVVYQPASAMRAQATSRPVVQQLKRSDGGLIIGEGENAWVRQFDDEGRLASRFRAAKWEPQKSGLVRVVRPEAELYLKGGKDKDGRDKPRPRVTIRGDDGEVVLQGLPDAASADKPLAPSQGMAPSASPSLGPTQPPSSGRLNGVIIQVFQTEEATEPVATLKTNNIVFDNETFRISTESYQNADGTSVAPDEVPVSVEGPYFDFYGRGLTVRWNDLEERLELLRVAHGDHLVIKDIQALSGAGVLPTVPPTAPPTAAGDDDGAGLPALAANDRATAVAVARADKRRAAAAAPAPATSPTSRPARRKDKSADRDKQEPTYRAAFEDDVRIVQGEQQLALAKLMNVDFLLGQKKPDHATTQPTTARAATTQPTTTQADTQAIATQPSATQSADSPATNPTTSPASEPVTVYWTGELNVTPLAAPTTAPTTAPARPPSPIDDPVSPGEARVELIGSPVMLTRDLLEVHTGRFVYRTNGVLFLDSTSAVPQVLITQRSQQQDGTPTTITTEGLTYARGDQMATLRGHSHVVAPIDTGRGGGLGGPGGPGDATAPDMLDASWRDSATFSLVGQGEQDLWVQHARLAGEVDIKAPQGTVRSHLLELSFDAPAIPVTQPTEDAAAADQSHPGHTPPGKSQPNLRRVVATDSVYCELIDAKEGKRTLQCQRLALDTGRSDEGELYPRVVDAAGEVHAATADQQLNAGHVLLHLRPASKPTPASDAAAAEAPADDNTAVAADDPARKSQPAVELESMTATDAVRVASADGAVAMGKRLDVTVADDGRPLIELLGDPARVEDSKNGILTGPRIQVDPRTGLAHVPGPGTLRAIQRDDKADPDSPGRPIEVTWADSADVRGAEDRIDITGSVSLWLTDTDGSVRTATGGRVTVELAKKPAATQPAAAEAPADKPAAPKRAVATAEKSPAANPLGQSMNMDLFKDKEVAKVHLYDNAVVNSKLTAADGTMLRQFHLKAGHIAYDVRSRHLSVPGRGQMLVESHEPSALAVAAEGAGDGARDGARAGAGGDAEPKQANAAAAPPAALSGGNGVTAFEWRQSLEYEQSAGQAVMDGAVVVSHQPDAKGGRREPPVRLDADTVTAMFETLRGEPGAADGTIPPPGPDAPDASRLQLKSVTAEGNILITREGAELSAHRIDYDPRGEWVIARGSGRDPARFSDPSGTGTFRAGELWLNTRTWNVKAKDVNTRVGAASR